MPPDRPEYQSLETVSLLDELPDRPVLSSRLKNWNGLAVEYHQHPANELVSLPLAHHLITLNCGLPYHLVQQLQGRLHAGEVAKGDIILTPAHEPTEWIWDRGVEVLHLCLEPSLIAKVAAEAFGVDSGRVEVLNQFAVADLQIQQLAYLLLSELRCGKMGGRLYAESLANALVVHLIREHTTTHPAPQKHHGGLSKGQLNPAIAYIEEHLDRNLSLDEMATEANLSAYHFARLFKRSTGLAPHQYQIHRRVESARRLLQDGELEIADVATRVGFYDQSHLSRHFKRIVGVSPKAVRQSKIVLQLGKGVQERGE